MSKYIDGFTLPIPRKSLEKYKQVSESVAEIWKEHGALGYFEYVGDDMELEGTQSFNSIFSSSEDELIIFGWVVFESRETRDVANERVAADPRMVDLIAPLTSEDNVIFDASRMAFGGFKNLIHSD